jgi:very-short-patch-repair endonuclease
VRHRVLIEHALGHERLLRRADVVRLGVGDRAWYRLVQSGEWVEIVPGVFHHVATPVTLDMQVIAGGWWLGRRGALFGDSALWWRGIRVPTPERIAFQTDRSCRQIPAWMELHTTRSLEPSDVVRHRGVRCSTATRAVLDWATTLPSPRRVEDAIDDAHRRRLLTIPQLTRRLSETGGRGRPGTVLLKELLLDSGGESFLERRFLRLVRLRGLPRPSCQVVYRYGGSKVARVDFEFPGANLVVEVSGRLGHTSDRERAKDAARRNALQRQGKMVLEFTTAHVLDDPDYVIGLLCAELTSSVSRRTGSPTGIRA